VDIYFDNVGGEILDDVLTRIGRGARIVICGAISQYNNTTPVQGPKNYLSLLVNRARMEGMVVFDYADRYPQAVAELAGYLKDGRMKSREDIVVRRRKAVARTSPTRCSSCSRAPTSASWC
jgi:NADPH-dependent curcumin reductase CurA